MKKRVFSLLVCALLMLGVLSGCGGGDATTAAPTGGDGNTNYSGRTLDVLLTFGGGGNYYEPVKNSLEKAFDGLTVNLVYDNTAAETMKNRTLAGNAPDIFNLNQGMYDYYGAIADGLCAPLDDYLELEGLNGGKLKDIVDTGLMVKGQVDGKYYIWPEVVFTSGLWYDANLFKDKGLELPTDWDSLLALSEKLKAEGIYTMGYCGMMAHEYPLDYWFYPMLISVDYDAFVKVQNLDDDAWESAGMKTVVSRLQELRDKGYIYTPTIALGNSETQMEHISHKFAFLPCGSWLEAEMADAWTDDWDVSFVPYSGRTSSSDSNYLHMITLVSSVYAETKNSDLVGEFYKYMYTDPDAIKGLVGVAQNGLPIKDFGKNYGSLLNKSTAQTWTAIDSGSKTFLSLTTAWYNESSKMFGDAFNAFMGGEIDGDAFRERMANTMKGYKDDSSITKYTFG